MEVDSNEREEENDYAWKDYENECNDLSNEYLSEDKGIQLWGQCFHEELAGFELDFYMTLALY